jgi:hypothetical protein
MEWSAPFKPLSSSSIRFDEAWVKIELVDVWIWHETDITSRTKDVSP